MKLIFELGVEGRGMTLMPECDVPEYRLPEERSEALHLPHVSENELTRHYTALCKRIHGVNDGFYPLGSCTMKYNPKIDEDMAALARQTADKLDAMGIKFKVVNVVDLVKLQSAKENNEALSDEEFAELFTEDKPVLFAYHSYARDVRGLIYDRPNHDNFNVHGYEEQGSTTTPYDMVRVNNIDRYELQAEALRMIDADKYADKINELEAFRQEAFQFAVDNGYDHPDYTDWVYSGVNTNKQGAVSATAATAGDNE